MDDMELKNIWQAYDQKLEQSKLLNLQSWVINLKTFESLQHHKAEMTLHSLLRFKIRVLVLGIVWCLLLAVLLYGARFTNPYFTVSIGAILLFNIAAVVVYVKHIQLIKSISYSDSITITQEKLSKLETSTINLRFLWLQTPFYCTWFWHKNWIHFDSADFWLITFPITMLFAVLGVYIFRQTTSEHMHKKWVNKLLMAGPEIKSVMRARAFLTEIEEFRREIL